MDASKIPLTSIELPDEVLIEILARLPVKSLIRFSSVCKYWFSLIKSPQFAIKHLITRKLSLQLNDCNYLVTYSSRSDPIVKILSYETLEISSIFECKPVNDDDAFDCVVCVNWSLFGPCNGIFCVEIRKINSVLLLWNPATREVFVPVQPVKLLDFVGFGFDERSNDYKIVMFGYDGNVEVYSLRRNCWRLIKAEFSFGEDKDVFVQIDPMSNGRMYTWMVYDSLCNGLCLLSFDMVEEVFVETPMPEDVKGCYFCFMQQRCDKAFPALLCFDLVNCSSRASRVDVWVLNEYGPTGYWTKEQSFSWPEDVNLGPPRGLWKNEGILFIGQERVLSCYDTVTRETRSLQVPGQQLLGYTESLISIKDVCQPGELADSLTKEAVQSPKDSEDSDEDDEDQGVQEIPYCLCEINKPVLSNSITF